MIKNRRLLKSVCFALSLIMLTQAFFISASPDGRLFAEEGEFVASEALSPGEYLEQVTELMGGNAEEIETHSYSQWAILLMNALIMLDPKGTDVMTFQYGVTRTLRTIEKVRSIAADLTKYVRWVEKIAAFGFMYFPGSGATKFHCLLLKVNFAMKALRNSTQLRSLHQTATFMRSPYSRGVSACKQWYKKGTPLVDASRPPSGLQTGAMKVGSVLQVIAGIMELSRFPGALDDDPGAPSFETVQIAINGAILIATALMAWPPPGAWTVAAFIIIGAWELIKGTLNSIGETIEKWHKSYADSLTFLREADDKFAAFYDENIDAISCPMPGDESPLIDPLERSSALVFADELRAALDENPGEGDIAERQKELVKNIRAQGILSTWYYQQEEAARMLPPDIKDLYIIWNHRADYMAFKPKKPRWGWPWDMARDGLAWLGNSAIQEIWGTEDQFVDDQGKFKELALFCPDFALMVLFRRYITSQAHSETVGEIPEYLSLAGVRIEQAPFNYMPLIEIYDNNFSNWTTEVFGQAFAADAFMTAAKETPYLTEQINYSKKSNEISSMHTLAKIVGAQIYSDDPKEAVLGLLKGLMLKQLEGSARMRAQFDALLEAYNEDKHAEIKDKRIDYSFNGNSDNFKLGKEIFKGKKMHDDLAPSLDFTLGFVINEFWSGILKDEDEQADADHIFRLYAEQLQTSLQLNLNSLGISGVDMVKLGIQLKNELDVLELARDNLKEKEQAVDSLDEIFTNSAIKKLITKGEFLDVSREGLSNFLSSFDPPKDVLDHQIGKLKEAIEKLEESIRKRKELLDTLLPLVQQEYAGWLETYKNYEEAADETGLVLNIRSSDTNYSKDNLELLAPIVALDPAAPAPAVSEQSSTQEDTTSYR